MSITSANGVPIYDVSDTMGHKSMHVNETVYRKVIVPAIRRGATVMDGVFSDRPIGAAEADAQTADDGAGVVATWLVLAFRTSPTRRGGGPRWQISDSDRPIDWTKIATCDGPEEVNAYELAQRWADRRPGRGSTLRTMSWLSSCPLNPLASCAIRASKAPAGRVLSEGDVRCGQMGKLSASGHDGCVDRSQSLLCSRLLDELLLDLVSSRRLKEGG